MSQMPQNWGLLARYENPAQLVHACETIRDARYTKWDACSPFPVHGIDEAMGIKRTVLPWFVFCGGLTGGLSAMGFMIWVSSVAYPLNIGGKPLLSIPAFIPVTFEVTVLFSALTTFFSLWFLNRLPQLFHPAFKSKAFESVTDDKFFIMIEAQDPKFNLEKTRELLKKTGASLVEELED